MKKSIFHFFKILVAIQLLAISVNMFLGPHQIAAGGVSGLGILAESTIGIDRSLVVLGLNVIMLTLAAIFLGKEALVNIVVGAVLFPLSLAWTPEIMLTSHIMLSVIFGSLVFGIGVGILYRIQASAGGTTIPPLILEKYFHVNPAIGLLATDMVIVFVSLLVFGVEEFLFAILSLIITSFVMNYIEIGLKRRIAVFITTQEKSETMKGALLEQVSRGMTVFDVTGGKTGNASQMMMMVASQRDYPKIMEVVDSIDPTSFVVVYHVSEVHGLGFSYHAMD